MATVVWKNADLIVNGVTLSGALHDLMIDIGAEMLDATVFGLNTRTSKGGLFTGAISGQGYFDTVVGIESVIFPDVGDDGTVLVVFPEGVVEGSANSGFAMQGVLSEFGLGGAVGTMGNIRFAAQTQGLEAL